MSWTKICCAVDFSGESRLAMEEAADLAWRLGVTLALVHVNELPVPPRAADTLAGPEAPLLAAAARCAMFALAVALFQKRVG